MQMKKLGVIGIALVLGTSVAFASSIAIPWFSDNAPAANQIPGITAGVTGLVTLKSNVTTSLVCSIAYYNAEGAFLGPMPPVNTFAIAPLSALAFRPVVADPGTVVGGQEGAQGVLVPDRPRSVDTNTTIPGTTVIDTKKNGSCTITWTGGDKDVQGQIAYFQTAASGQTMSYAHLLPPGV